ncbi:uncharacterized protein BO66DRAFT_389745 [Aspergillus aculeatinus CBS 121060]|uniref:Uncharacterized protein n=1 Tax=Aspergillus aculeatinus CBS 121060 TaxID=1448322 RepID=A0ACD1HGI6_9EURO|nr:hypothetical protein BO66DRAFT_389745 [Aspergillus aculeatinus CBS 121060]RAH72771.1 hypothetical protein BO66DRAFT_389745 [Aspergillus aculeatinus CBS 121060]
MFNRLLALRIRFVLPPIPIVGPDSWKSLDDKPFAGGCGAPCTSTGTGTGTGTRTGTTATLTPSFSCGIQQTDGCIYTQ